MGRKKENKYEEVEKIDAPIVDLGEAMKRKYLNPTKEQMSDPDFAEKYFSDEETYKEKSRILPKKAHSVDEDEEKSSYVFGTGTPENPHDDNILRLRADISSAPNAMSRKFLEKELEREIQKRDEYQDYLERKK